MVQIRIRTTCSGIETGDFGTMVRSVCKGADLYNNENR